MFVFGRLAFLATLLRTATHAELLLKQMHVVTRHGSSDIFDDSFHLSPFGKLQMQDLGEFLLFKYGDTLPIKDGYSRDTVRFSSSNTGASILSAQIVAKTLFGDDDLVPIYAEGEGGYNDVFIRAFMNCPSLASKHMELSNSTTWMQKQNDHINLLQYLSLQPPFQKYLFDDNGENGDIIPLERLIEVYDMIALAGESCTVNVTTGFNGTFLSLPEENDFCSTQHRDLLEVLSPEQWKELTLLANEVAEDMWNDQKAGRWSTGNLWRDILENGDTVDSSKLISDGFFFYSGHYETLITFFTAVGAKIPRSGLDGSSTIPSYGSAAIVEVYIDTTTKDVVIKISYKDSTQADAEAIVLDNCSGDGSCSESALMPLFDDLSIEAWCDECQNSFTDVCMEHILLDYFGAYKDGGDATTDDTDLSKGDDTVEYNGDGRSDSTMVNPTVCPTSSRSGASGAAVAVTFFMGLLIGVAGLGVLMWQRSKKQRQMQTTNDALGLPASKNNDMDLDDINLDDANFT